MGESTFTMAALKLNDKNFTKLKNIPNFVAQLNCYG